MSKSALIGCTRWLAACFAAMAFLWSPSTRAVVGTVDGAPAATLLLPYFETDLGDPNGTQTTVRISNASATAMLLHSTLYTDLGVPTLQFDTYLVGYDSVDIDLRLLFKGIVPQTASAGQDPTDLISPQGPLSQDINFASCSGGVLPPPGLPPTSSGVLPANTTWDVGTVAAIRAAHTGQASTLWSGQCGAVAHGDNIARGYMTIDTVNNCTMRYPSDPGYFAPGFSGDATMQNVLYGTSTTINRNFQTVYTENLVPVEASFNDPTTSTPGIQTFYGSQIGNTPDDGREALGTVWTARSMEGAVFNFQTKFVVWRDPGQAVSPFACGGALPPPFPLTTREVVAFDEEENLTPAANNLIPYATQLVDGEALSPYTFGIVRFDLGLADGTVRQGYVSSRILRLGARNATAFPGSLLMTAPQAQCFGANPQPAMCANIPPASYGVVRDILP
ncbi:MAG: hypothetical protein ACTHK2_00320 [Dokdonella sp.]|uniref:hypothetical protein n=1 Tax=Dokdonella sp. TaxID=2291710 RepID=UPI003F804E68